MGPLSLPLIGRRRSPFLYPRDFLGDWLFQGSSRTGGATAPDGSTSAITMTDTAASTQHRAFLPTQTTAAGETVYGVRAKAGTIGFIQLALNDTVTSWWANFNLSTGAIASKQASTTARVTPIGDGWYLCELLLNTAAGRTGNAQILMLASDAASLAPAYLGDGAGTVLLAAAP